MEKIWKHDMIANTYEQVDDPSDGFYDDVTGDYSETKQQLAGWRRFDQYGCEDVDVRSVKWLKNNDLHMFELCSTEQFSRIMAANMPTALKMWSELVGVYEKTTGYQRKSSAAERQEKLFVSKHGHASYHPCTSCDPDEYYRRRLK